MASCLARAARWLAAAPPRGRIKRDPSSKTFPALTMETRHPAIRSSRPLPGLRDAYEQVAHPEERGHPRGEAVHDDDRGCVVRIYRTRGNRRLCRRRAGAPEAVAGRAVPGPLPGSAELPRAAADGACLAQEPHCQRGRSDPAAVLSLLLPSSPHSSLTRGSISLFCLASISSGETGLQPGQPSGKPAG